MEKTKMTIHRALSELKLIDSTGEELIARMVEERHRNYKGKLKAGTRVQ